MRRAQNGIATRSAQPRTLSGASLLALVLAGPAAAQGLLPATGADIRPGDLRRQFDRAYQRGPALTEPGWRITPAIDATVGWTDGLTRVSPQLTSPLAAQRTRSDFFTTISPSIAITGNSPRLEGSLVFAPQLRRYLSTPSENSISTTFAGRGRAIVVPELFFVDVSGTSALQSRSGGQGQTATLSRDDQVQTTNYSIAPYLQRRFGDYGIAELGVSYQQTFTDAKSGVAVSPFSQPITTRPATTSGVHTSFITGEFLNRMVVRTEASSSRSTGGGALQGASRSKAGSDIAYKITRVVALTGALGWEDIKYGGTTPFKSSGLTWSGGVRLTPDPDTSISVSYGRRDAGNSASLDATYAPTARIRLSARYSEGLSTGQEDFQNALALSDLDANGTAVDRQTGIPISVTNNFFGAGSGQLNRTRRLSVTAVLLMDRNVISVSVRRDEQQQVGNAPGVVTINNRTGATRNEGIYGTISYQRDLNPGLIGNLYSQIGQRQSGGTINSSQDTLSLGASMTWSITETLSSRLDYTYTNNSSSLPGQSQSQNTVLAGVRKSF